MRNGRQTIHPPTTVASGQHDPAAIAIDGSNVYWGNAGTKTPAT